MNQWMNQSGQAEKIKCWITAENVIRPEHLPDSQAEGLLKKADQLFNSAKQEINQAGTISQLIPDAENSMQARGHQTSLAMIRVWHYESGVELINQALRNFEQALYLGLSNISKEKANLQIKKCQEQLNAILQPKETAEKYLSFQFQKTGVYLKN